MLSHFGLRKTMLIKTGVDAIVLGAAYLLIKERRKPSTSIIWFDKKFLTDPTFWSITVSMCLSNFGFPAPFFYLPTFAKQKVPNLTELVGTRYDKHAGQWRLTTCDSFPPSPLPLSTYQPELVVVAQGFLPTGLDLQTPCSWSSLCLVWCNCSSGTLSATTQGS